ncbi:MAG: hypothetical protein NVSMB51_00520 [Solirubrobacteraceae bacterium]
MDTLAQRALEGLLRAEASVRRALVRELDGAGVSASGFSLLLLLRGAGGVLEQRSLIAGLGTSKANASELIATLQERELVRSRPSAGDRRARSVALTERGAQLIAELLPGHAERVARAFATLDEDDKRSLARICDKLAA